MLSPLIMIPVLTQDMGLAIYGEYVSLLALVGLFVVISDFGLDMYLTKQISKNNEDQHTIINYVNFFYKFKLIISIVCFIPITSIMLLSYNLSIEIIVIINCYLLLNNIKPSCLLNGIELYSYQTKIELLGKLLIIISIFLFSFKDNGMFKAICVISISYVIVNSLLYYKLYKLKLLELSLSIPGKSILIVKEAFEFYIARIFVNVYSKSSTYFVSLVLASELVAIYSVGIQLYKVGQAIIGAISKVLYTNTIKTQKLKDVYITTLISIVALLIISPIVFLFGESILDYIFPAMDSRLYSIAKILYLSLMFVIIASYWGYPVLSAFGLDRYGHLGIFIGSIVYYLSFTILWLSDSLTLITVTCCILLTDIITSLTRLSICYLKLSVRNKMIND